MHENSIHQSPIETATDSNNAPVYTGHTSWYAERPHLLVVTCSDGRLQANIDDFLHDYLNINSYDRMYVPGGPGALARSGDEPVRYERCWSECSFLIEAHVIAEVILIFHGASENGPAIATCADYTRKLPQLTPEQIRRQHETDAVEIAARLHGTWPHLRIRIYRAEVMESGLVQFVDLIPQLTPEEKGGAIR